jgi:dolichyl-phosphate-mannose-protein mannosyltransferase
MEHAQISTVDKTTPALPLQIRRWWERDVVLAGVLFLLTLLSRLPFQSHVLYHWDSVNFAFAIREFNIAKEQPQPPGYIVYVWLCRLVNAVTGDAQITMVSISLVASALAVAALFYLGRSMFDRRTGVVAALCLATSPLFWFYGEIALPHTLDTLLVIVSAWWLYETMRGDYRYLYPAIVVLAVAGGVRQQTLVFLAPVTLFALRRVGWRRFILAGLLGAVVSLASFVPLVVLSGGLANYLSVVGAFSERFQKTTSIVEGSGWWGLRRNLIKLGLYTAYAWSIAVIPGVLYALLRLRQRRPPQRWERLTFVFLWIAPALVFYTFIHMGQQGLVFVFLPALLLISAAGLTRLFSARLSQLMAATTALAMANAAIFLILPEYPLGPNTQRLLTWSTLVNSDHYYQDRFDALQAHFDPGSTVILAANWHHVEYYLPEYKKLPFGLGSKWELDQGLPLNDPAQHLLSTPAELGLHPDADGQVVVVIFDPPLEEFNATPQVVQRLALPHGTGLAYMRLGVGDHLSVNADSYGVLAR